MALRDHYLFVCLNRRADDNPKGCCASRGADAVFDALKQAVFAKGLKSKCRVCSSSCLDECADGVTILVEPDHFFYGHVTLEDVSAIVEALERGERVERLVLR